MTVSVMWFRNDLRLHDQPALRAAVEAGDEGVVPLFVLDDHFATDVTSVRRAYLSALLAEFDERIGGLHVVHGDPATEVDRVVRAAGASSVHVTEAPTPYGRTRDDRVEAALDVPLVRTGSPYAVTPGRVTKSDGEPYRVFTPFFRAWREHGWRAPAPAVRAASVPWLRPTGRTHRIPAATAPRGLTLPPAGEQAARDQWHAWLRDHVDDYGDDRDRPDLDSTSRMSVPLKWGAIHPRTMLADLAERNSDGARAYGRQLAFREFYADVLADRPDSAFGYWNRDVARMQYDDPAGDVEAWREGRTGFPFVDAGMRQLLAEGWMHNRVRMVVASFLVKDLHVEWTHGARWFRERLLDADLANNQHGWQWVAGSGTDAAPYFRVFNPVSQGLRFDPDGSYVRRWVPELGDVAGPAVHEPWKLRTPPAAYPAPLVDHAQERLEALRRWDVLRG